MTGTKLIKDGDTGETCISLSQFMQYMNRKRIKVNEKLVSDICEGDTDVEAIRFVSLVKLQLLASCNGEKTKLSVKNFRKLMKHMDIIST